MMSKTVKLFAISLIAIVSVSSLYAQNKLDNASKVKALKINELKVKRIALQKRIDSEDKKRNVEYELSASRKEELNKKQDSICLALRSQRVMIELEIEELSK